MLSRNSTMACERPMTRGSSGRPMACPCSRSSQSPNAWKVWMAVSACPYGTSRSTRACISSAARSVKVNARISDGRARLLAMSHATRRVMTSVLPVPGPATTSSGPSACVTAWRWRRSSPLSKSRTASIATGAADSGEGAIWPGERCCGDRMAVIGAQRGSSS